MAYKPNIKFIDTPYGKTYIKTIGQGPLVFVLHGGPGFCHNYLEKAANAFGFEANSGFL